jgi:hypothetical protein
MTQSVACSPHVEQERHPETTVRDFSAASGRLPHSLAPLVSQMPQTGKALEQEAVWLAG